MLQSNQLINFPPNFTLFQDKPRKNESVLANMKQYGLESHYLDVLVGDSSLPIWRPELTLDAIITDREFLSFFIFDC